MMMLAMTFLFAAHIHYIRHIMRDHAPISFLETLCLIFVFDLQYLRTMAVVLH